MASHAVSHPVLVDVTSEDTADLLRTALGQGFDIVMANKKPVAGPWESYEALMRAARSAGRTIRHEATVGAGLPIIDTYDKLAETGDRVLRVEGTVSGTLMYVVSAVSSGKPFSAGRARGGRTGLRRAGSARGPVGARTRRARRSSWRG